MLASDALFVALYLLRMAKRLPAREFSWLRGDPYLKAYSVYFLKDLFLLENQIPLTILLAVVGDFCHSRMVERGEAEMIPSPESLLRTAVLVALGERLKKVFRPADSERNGRLVSTSNGWQVMSESEFRQYLEDGNEFAGDKLSQGEAAAKLDLEQCDHLLDCLLQVICFRPSSQGWARGWERDSTHARFVNRTRFKRGARYDVGRLTAKGYKHLESLQEPITREGLIYSLRMRPGLDHGPDLEVSEDFTGSEMVLESLGKAAEALREELRERRPVSHEAIGDLIRAADLQNQDWSYNIEALVSTLGCAKSISSAWWARANLEFCRCWRYATGGDWGVSLIQERALKRCVGEFTRNSLIEGLQDIKKTASSAPAARIKGYGLMLSYYAERAALMNALMVAVTSKPLKKSSFPLVQVLMEAVAARPPMDPMYVKVIRMAISPAFKDAQSSHKWPSVVLDHPVALGHDNVDLAEENWPIESARKWKAAGIGVGRCDMIYQVDMDFRGPRPLVRIPHLYIDDGTDSLFRNLAALERMKGDWETPFACFLKLVDNLVDTEEDVALLREAGVVVHHLGSDAAVAKMWNELALGLPFYPSAEWATLLFNVNNRTKDWKKQYWVEFREKYFSRPWYASALVVAASLLLLSIAQTVLAALQLVPHPH